jgi:23S rRNA pseudouridine2605 synthase
MTNDGELAEQITHPRLELAKVYRVEVRGRVPPDLIAKMKKGVHLAEGKALASEVEVVRRSRDRSTLNITLRTGRNRQIRRMLAWLDHPVRTLKRVQIGPLSLKGLPVGACRRLTPRELVELRRAVRAASSTHARIGIPRDRTRKDRPARRGAAKGETHTRPRGPAPPEGARPPRRLVT